MFILAVLEVTSAASKEEICQKWYFHCSVSAKKDKKTSFVPHFTTWHLNLIFAYQPFWSVGWPYSCTSSHCLYRSSCATTCKMEYCWNLWVCIQGSDRCQCTLVITCHLWMWLRGSNRHWCNIFGRPCLEKLTTTALTKNGTLIITPTLGSYKFNQCIFCHVQPVVKWNIVEIFVLLSNIQIGVIAP